LQIQQERVKLEFQLNKEEIRLFLRKKNSASNNLNSIRDCLKTMNPSSQNKI